MAAETREAPTGGLSPWETTSGEILWSIRFGSVVSFGECSVFSSGRLLNSGPGLVSTSPLSMMQRDKDRIKRRAVLIGRPLITIPCVDLAFVRVGLKEPIAARH